jgi:hypothetical protein
MAERREVMSEYHKIQTVFKRDPATKHKGLLIGQYSIPEFEYLRLNQWVFSEKVDGTNIRVIIEPTGVRFGGKTDNAQIPSKLVECLNAKFLPIAVRQALQELFPDGAVLYGEGYGAGIQSGGNYRQDQAFVLFDARVCKWWLSRESVEEIAAKFSLDVAPIIGAGTLDEMVKITQAGFSSRWGDFKAEGIVARPAVELCTRGGERIITKIKYKDFSRS